MLRGALSEEDELSLQAICASNNMLRCLPPHLLPLVRKLKTEDEACLSAVMRTSGITIHNVNLEVAPAVRVRVCV